MENQDAAAAFTPEALRETVPGAENYTDDQLRAALRDAMISLGLIEGEAA